MMAVRFILGLCLLPCCVAVSRSFWFLVAGPGGAGAAFWAAAGGGLLLWAVVFAFAPSPVKSYVLAHELSHAISGAVMGASVMGMRVSKTGGSVRLSESNSVVALAPYFLPLYTLAALALYALAGIFADTGAYRAAFVALAGFTTGHHLFFTAAALGRRQDDIQRCGRMFSFAFIYFMNLFVISLSVVALSKVSLEDYVSRLAADFAGVWHFMASAAAAAFGAAVARLSGRGA